MFDKILIANRGEIAVRVIRTCRKLGVKSVAVFSDIDFRSRHVREADEAVYLGPAPSESSYLLKEKIIEQALKLQCQAIHPGYGFLSENAQFAEMVKEAGMVFIGPPPDVIASLGDKIEAKALAIKAGVPVVPGHNEPISDAAAAESIAREIGYPVLLKPAAGGGGRGMRIVHAKEELAGAFKAGQEETRKAFADDKLFIERFVESPRHIEVQIMADTHGNVVYLGERECSVQRRYQKVIEEAPSVALTPEMRQHIGKSACRLTKVAGYVNAGTVEFILDPKGEFFFLEMNTRLQVEHPVTELITDKDLVEIQLEVASGKALSFSQEEVVLNGWSIEARICAEDPERNFLPSTGLITRYSEPQGDGVRTDSGITAGSTVSVYYDSMLAKIISHGRDREEARKRLANALNRFHVEGVISNVDFANAIINHPAFIAGDLNTHFIEEHFDTGVMIVEPPMVQLEKMVIAATLVYHNRKNLVKDSLKPLVSRVGLEHKKNAVVHYVVKGLNTVFDIRMEGNIETNEWSMVVNNNEYAVVTPSFEFYRRRLKLSINNEIEYFRLQYKQNFIWTSFDGVTRTFEIYSPKEWELAGFMPPVRKTGKENILCSPMPGLVVEMKTQPGERVYKGQDLVVIESMKMESGVASPCDGEVNEVKVKAGQAVETGDIMITFNI